MISLSAGVSSAKIEFVAVNAISIAQNNRRGISTSLLAHISLGGEFLTLSAGSIEMGRPWGNTDNLQAAVSGSFGRNCRANITSV
jgi:hypothetical protein